MKKISFLFIISLFLHQIYMPTLKLNSKTEKSFKIRALENNISEETFIKTMSNVRFLPNVIKYDRYQPEFYEDTETYISKRTSSKKQRKELISIKRK